MRMLTERRRSGFTLIELLTVIAIIIVLAALAVGTYFRVRNAQQEKATETTLAKLQSEMDQQVRAVHDTVSDEKRSNSIPPTVVTMANNDEIRIKVIWEKIRLKQEFPQNFWEATEWPRQISLYLGRTVEARYMRDIGLPPASVARDPLSMTAGEQYLESAALLYMALTKGRRGVAGFKPGEHLGAHAVGTVSIPVTTSPPTVRDFKVFLDSWGQPIAFCRWPFGARTTDLNADPYVHRNKAGQPVDPQDPEKSLFNADWWKTAQPNNFIAAVGHPLDPTLPPLNLSPVIFSAGRDMRVGVLAYGPAGPANCLQVDPAAPDDESDNVYSYRVKVGRGN